MLKTIICFDCEQLVTNEALKKIKPFVLAKYNREVKKIIKSKYTGQRFCEHFTIEYWKNLGFEDTWGDAAVRNYPHLTIMRWSDDKSTKFLILAPYITRRPVLLNALDPQAWGSY